MKLTKLVLNDNTYRSPRRSFQGIKVNNIGNIQKSLIFAQHMTFSDEESAFHRKNRSGGIEVRNQNQLFENTFQGKLSEFMKMMEDPETGLSVTKSSEGYINIDVFVDEDNSDVLILDQKWKTKENHQAYVQMRKDTGLFDKLTDLLEVEPEIRYIKALS